MVFELSSCLGTVVENWVFFRGTFFLTLISVFERSFLGDSNLVNSILCLEGHLSALSCLFSLAKSCPWANRWWWFLCSW